MTRRRRIGWWTLVIALAAAAVSAAALGGWQLTVKSRPLPADQVAERTAATDAAAKGMVAILSYSPGTVQQTLNAAEATLTRDLLDSFKQAFNQVIVPATQQHGTTVTAVVMSAGVQALTSDAAEIVLAVNQTTTTREKPDPTNVSNSMLVALTRVNGKWLINRFSVV
jgi:Mce-associated membrane protein